MSKELVNTIFKYLISIIGSLVVFFLFRQYCSEEISKNSSILPSIATFENVDIGKRISNFYWALFLSSITFAALLWLTKAKAFKCSISSISNKNILIIFVLSLVIFENIGQLNLPIVLIVFIGLSIYKIIINDRVNKFLFINLIFLLPITLLIIEVLNLKYHYDFQFILVFGITTVVIIPLLKNNYFKKIEKPFVLFSASVPIQLVLYKEIFLILNQNGYYILAPFFFLIALLLLSIIVIKIVLKKIESKKINTIHLFATILLLMGMVLWKNYYIVYQHTNEVFEFANLANPIMRWFKSGDIPIIDALSSHVFSDLSVNPLYVLLNGYSGKTDFMIYFTFLNSFIIPGVFIVLTRIFKNALFVFLLLIFIPSYELIMGHSNGYIFVTLLLIWKYLQKPKSSLIFLLLLWNSLLLITKIEVGTSSIIMTSVLFIIQIFMTKIWYNKFIIKGGTFYITLGILIVLFCLLIQPNLLNHFLQAKDYFTSNQAHGFAKVVLEPNFIYYINYIILPLLLAFYGVHIIRIQLKNKSYIFIDFVLIGLISFYLFHTQRGLVRHSLIENSTFHISSFAFLIISLIVYKNVNPTKQIIKYGVFIGSFFFCANVLSLDKTNMKPSILSKIISKSSQSQKTHHYSQKLDRALDYEHIKEETAGDFIQFMNENFNDSATFLDFCNIPMFYFYSQREVPSYFNQYMQNTVTDYLQKTNIELLKTKNIPVVLFSQNPKNWWDAIDGVENTIRNFRMTQYIYENYQPHSSINHINIWMKKGLDISNKYQEVSQPNHSYNLMQYPSILGQFSKSTFKTIEIWKNVNKVNTYTKNKRINQFVKISFEDYSDYESLNLKYYSDSNQLLGEFKFTGKSKTFIIPVSSQYAWFNNKNLNVELTGNSNYPVSIEILQLYEYKK